MLVSVWKMLGYFVVVYGVGLRNIPDDLLEAAELDGATPWQRLIYIVIPMMKPIILFTVIIATIIFFNVFAPVYVLTASAQGAPAYDFKVVIGEIYQNAFVFYRMGYAGAQSVVLLLFVLTLVFIQFSSVPREALMFKERPIVIAAYVVCTIIAVARRDAVLLGADDGAQDEPGDQRLAAAVSCRRRRRSTFLPHPRRGEFPALHPQLADHRALVDDGDPVHLVARGFIFAKYKFPVRGACCSRSFSRPRSSRSKSTSFRFT